jgi:hypothetical protein
MPVLLVYLTLSPGRLSASEFPFPISKEMNQQKPTASRRSRGQPTVAQLEKHGIKVKDFAYTSTLPPVPTVRLQPRQIQPSVAQGLRREDTEPVDDINPGSGKSALTRVDTEPIPEKTCHSLAREKGGFLDLLMDRIVTSRPVRLHPGASEYSEAIQRFNASQKQPPSPSEPDTPPKTLSQLIGNGHASSSGSPSPIIPLPPSPPRYLVLGVIESPSRYLGLGFIESPSSAGPSRKRRKID